MRALALSAGLGAMALLSMMTPTAGADPANGSVVFAIGKCWNPSEPVVERPAKVLYNCDGTSLMQEMTWTSWGPDGAQGTGIDTSIECQPNCAVGPVLVNPIIVRAWNPKPAGVQGCPAGVEFYNDMTIAYPQGVPPWIKPGMQWDRDTEFVTVDGMPTVRFSNMGAYTCTPLGQ